LAARNDSPKLVLRESGSAELERALKVLAPVFKEARGVAKRSAHYISPTARRRLKALRAKKRLARHGARMQARIRGEEIRHGKGEGAWRR
jgi:hypothetical protein